MKLNRIIPLLTLLMPLLISPVAVATTFRNSYVSFDLPDRWNCILEQTEYVCRAQTAGQESKEAVIILTAKEAGPADNLAAYEAHLKTPKSIPSLTGVPTQSQVVKVPVIRNIHEHPWVDGFQLGSEIPNYYSRYMATLKDRIGILVTFSAHKKYYTKYANDFFKAIESLRVLVTAQSLNSGQSGLGGSGGLGSAINLPNDSGGLGDEIAPEEGSGGSGSGLKKSMLLLGLVVAALGLYFFFKSKSKDKPKRK
jgi:hypothetical protein